MSYSGGFRKFGYRDELLTLCRHSAVLSLWGSERVADNKIAVLRRGKILPASSPTDFERERRLHLRAHGYWSSLSNNGEIPLWTDFDPLLVDDRCTQSFVLDLNEVGDEPNIRLIGPALKAEGGMDADTMGFGDAPQGSLLVRISIHFPELVTRRVPLSVESPFETGDGRPGIYRGLLMPFSSSGETIDIVFGVVSWRELESPTDLPDSPRDQVQLRGKIISIV